MFALLSASLSTALPKANGDRHRRLRGELAEHGLEAITCQGVYTGQDGKTVHEDSFLVPLSPATSWLPLLSLAKRYGQESILLDNGGLGTLVFCSDGHVANLGRRTPGIADNYTDTPLGAFHYA